jgi:preprotein translocase subunit YajC
MLFEFLSMTFTQAFAQEAATQANEAAPAWMSLVPFALMFLVFYLLIIRPQAKKARETQVFLQSLKKGDEVLTAGGIFGTIVGVTEKFVDLKISENSRIKVLKSHVSGSIAEEKKENKKK